MNEFPIVSNELLISSAFTNPLSSITFWLIKPNFSKMTLFVKPLRVIGFAGPDISQQ
jgi:hypothetical protein